jgi:hypothetical protein
MLPARASAFSESERASTPKTGNGGEGVGTHDILLSSSIANHRSSAILYNHLADRLTRAFRTGSLVTWHTLLIWLFSLISSWIIADKGGQESTLGSRCRYGLFDGAGQLNALGELFLVVHHGIPQESYLRGKPESSTDYLLKSGLLSTFLKDVRHVESIRTYQWCELSAEQTVSCTGSTMSLTTTTMTHWFHKEMWLGRTAHKHRRLFCLKRHVKARHGKPWIPVRVVCVGISHQYWILRAVG